jgi:hypothetical protein
MASYQFQMDLTLEILEYAIKLDWENIEDEKTKPQWMRKMNRIPCSCGKCFFCKNGLTHGIDHRVGRMTPSTETARCPAHPKHMSEHPTYCRVCYQDLRTQHPEWSANQIKSKCHQTQDGCIVCRVHVCKWCWDDYEHDLEGQI